MKVFVTGSTGLLGSTLLRLASPKYILGASYNINKLVPNISCTYYHVDITDQQLVQNAFRKFNPGVVIHTAALATPDYCDKHQDEAWLVNVEGTKNIINACKKQNSILVYVTTNGVYNGKNPPYDENSIPKPIDFYGKTKHEGEKLVQNSGIPFIIMRLITMYGWNNPKERQNPVTWLLYILGKNKTPVNMVNDMYNNFLFVESAAEAIWKAINKRKIGESFNIAGKDCISRYDFSKEIARVFGLDKSMIYPVTSDFFKNFVPRPKNTCFDTGKMKKILNINPLSIKNGLTLMKKNNLAHDIWREIV